MTIPQTSQPLSGGFCVEYDYNLLLADNRHKNDLDRSSLRSRFILYHSKKINRSIPANSLHVCGDQLIPLIAYTPAITLEYRLSQRDLWAISTNPLPVKLFRTKLDRNVASNSILFVVGKTGVKATDPIFGAVHKRVFTKESLSRSERKNRWDAVTSKVKAKFVDAFTVNRDNNAIVDLDLARAQIRPMLIIADDTIRLASLIRAMQAKGIRFFLCSCDILHIVDIKSIQRWHDAGMCYQTGFKTIYLYDRSYTRNDKKYIALNPSNNKPITALSVIDAKNRINWILGQNSRA